MTENLHPGHKVLRELEPDPHFRSILVAAMCGVRGGTHDMILVDRVHRILVSHSVIGSTLAQREQIAAFINSI